MSYFEDGDTLPSPFNIMPSLGLLKDIFGVGEKVKTCSIKVFAKKCIKCMTIGSCSFSESHTTRPKSVTTKLCNF
jgi:hypothetical protein